MQVRVSPTEHGKIAGLAEIADQDVTTFVRDAALGALIEAPLPAEAFACAAALAVIGISLSRAVAEADAGRPVGIDPAELRQVITLVEAASLAAIGTGPRP